MSRSNKKESGFQDNLRKILLSMFPGCMVLKVESFQGIPDLLVLYKNKWVSLEVKKNATAKHQPNQDYYVDLMNKMSFSRIIFPENKDKILSELKKFFES